MSTGLLADCPRKCPSMSLPPRDIESLIGFQFHRGILACGRRPTNPSPADLITPRDKPLFLLIAVDVHDPENLGTIIRTAASFKVDALVLSEQCPSPFSRRVLRTSMGSVLRVPISIVPDATETIRWLREAAEVTMLACVLDPKAVPLEEFHRPARLGLVIGNEGNGLAPQNVEACSGLITIPMAERIDSLNVSIAAGIMMHYFARLAVEK